MLHDPLREVCLEHSEVFFFHLSFILHSFQQGFDEVVGSLTLRECLAEWQKEAKQG
jgi:hypothetical protein